MKILYQLCLGFCLWVAVLSFPTTTTTGNSQQPSNEGVIPGSVKTSSGESNTSQQTQSSNTSSRISTTSSLLFKDTKPILTYLLGQPKKQGSLSSPAELLSPDRYEFFTFDDDGQIVKKLMSVKEIQKIIANNDKESPESNGTPIEYYQILTVTPDVESIPSVSRINPNEPLFSIHDVIASVQNVLRSEMKTKETDSHFTGNENYFASASSDHFDIVTNKPEAPYKVDIQKTQSPTTERSGIALGTPVTPEDSVKTSTNLPPVEDFRIASASTPSQKISTPATTSKPLTLPNSGSTHILGISSSTPPTQQNNFVPVTSKLGQGFSSEYISTTSFPSTQNLNPKVSPSVQPISSTISHTVQHVPSVNQNSQSSLSAQNIPSTTAYPATQQFSSTTGFPSTEHILSTSVFPSVQHLPSTTTQKPNPESEPLSLIGAHPGLFSNESFLEQKPFSLDQMWKLKDSQLKETIEKNSGESYVKIPTMDPNLAAVEKVQLNNKPVSQASAASAQPPYSSDLAHSVSSVMWQIASENSMIDNSKPVKVADSGTLNKDFQQVPAKNTNERIGSLPQTNTFSQTSNLKKTNQELENPYSILESILRPQNKPRPFQSVPIIEKGSSETQNVESSTFVYNDKPPSPSSTVVIITETEEKNTGSKLEGGSKAQIEANLMTAVPDISTTTVPPTFVVSLSPAVVTQSPEHVRPFAEKIMAHMNTSTTSEASPQTIHGVQIVQEGKVGQIPRTTEFPGQIVKETEEVSGTNGTLSESDTFSVPEVPQNATLVVEIGKPTESINGPQSGGNEGLVESSKVPVKESKLEGSEENIPAPSERIDFTFVPMLIKTPEEFKQEGALLESKTQPEVKDEMTFFEKSEVSSETPVVTSTESINSNIQTKVEMQEWESDTLSQAGGAKQDSILIENGDPSGPLYMEVSTLKPHNPGKPSFGKPLKPISAKPEKGKPQADTKNPKPYSKEQEKQSASKKPYENHLQSSPSVLELEAAPVENLGLEATTVNLDKDIKEFSELCNELAFSLWASVTHSGLSFVRSLVISPFAVNSLLAMVFLGARGPTSGQMNDVLRLDDMVTFNPHLVFRNVTESLTLARNQGVATAAFVRELYSDKSKGKLLDFYKERAQQFYDGHVEEVNFKTIGETLRKQTNNLVKRQTWGTITDFLRGSTLMPRPPLAAFSANIFQTDCSKASIKDRDGEMYFVILPASRLRRLVPIPAVVWREGFLAGYDPSLDATAASIGSANSVVSTIFVLPGQQGLIAPGDTLARLEHHLLGSSYRAGHWVKLMRSLLPRPGLELQVPRLSHKSVVNVTAALQRMGLKDLFSADKADLTGLNGLANDLHLSDMLQVNLFSNCGEEPIGSRHHSEIYPATPILRREKSSDNIFTGPIDNLFAISDFEDPAVAALPLELRPRQARIPLSKPGARIPEPPRLRFDRPFLFFVRHNPTGLILHMGRFNPRLMP